MRAAALELRPGDREELGRWLRSSAFLKQVAKAYPDDGTGQELHLVMDNYAAHKRVEVRDWLAANPRLTSTSRRRPGRG